MKPYAKLQLGIAAIICLLFGSCSLGMNTPRLDPYTNVLTLATDETEIAEASSSYINAYISVSGLNFYELHLNIYTHTVDYKDYTISDQQQTIFQLVNNQLIYFTNEKPVKTTLVTINKSYFWQAKAVYKMNKDQVKQLASSKFNVVRLENSRGNLDFAVSDKQTKNISKLSQLALKAGGDQ